MKLVLGRYFKLDRPPRIATQDHCNTSLRLAWSCAENCEVVNNMYAVEFSPICVRGLVAVSGIRTVLVRLSEQFESNGMFQISMLYGINMG